MPERGKVGLILHRCEAASIVGWLDRLADLKANEACATDPELAELTAWFRKLAARSRPTETFTVQIHRHWASWFEMLADHPNGFTVQGTHLPANEAVITVGDRCHALLRKGVGRPSNSLDKIAALATGRVKPPSYLPSAPNAPGELESSERTNRRARADLTEDRLQAEGHTVLGSIELYIAAGKIRPN